MYIFYIFTYLWGVFNTDSNYCLRCHGTHYTTHQAGLELMTGVLFQPTSSEIIDIRHYTWLFDFLWDFISLFYEYECLPECLSVPHARDAGGVQNPADALGLEVQMTVTCHMGTGELNPGVLEEQPLNSSLSHLILFFLSLPSSLLSLSSLPPFLSVWYREPNPEPYTC